MRIHLHNFVEFQHKLHSETFKTVLGDDNSKVYRNAVFCSGCLETRVWNTEKSEWTIISAKISTP